MMLHQGEHVYIHTLKDSNMLDIMYCWLEHYLKGVDNGIEKEPAVLVERAVVTSPYGWHLTHGHRKDGRQRHSQSVKPVKP